MPAILRKSLPELLASLVIIGSYASVGIIVSHGGGRWGAWAPATLCRADHGVPLFYGWRLFFDRLGREGDPHYEHGNDCERVPHLVRHRTYEIV